MNQHSHLLTSIAVLIALALPSRAAGGLSFSKKELFQVPFGDAKEALGARVEGSNFLIPRDFTLDEAGHFYIYDTNKHRIARYSHEGQFEMDFRYLSTARQVFAHADDRQNLWVLLSDPGRGLYYGVYDVHGKRIRSGVFSQFNDFRLHPEDDGTLHIVVSSDKDPQRTQTYYFDPQSYLMKKDNVARPPVTHHELRRTGHTYYIDQVPNGAKTDADQLSRVTDEKHQNVGAIKGSVLYMTDWGDVYTRVGEREIDVYDIDGSLKGRARLEGLAAACAAVRFDAEGNIYELDGIPDASGAYTPTMTGMRLIVWQRS